MNKVKLFLITAAVSLCSVGCSETTAPTANNSRAANASTPALSNSTTPGATSPAPVAAMDGKEVYALNCMICHKDTGKGGKVTIEGKSINPDDLTAEKFKKMTDEKMIGYVTNGVEDEGMPAFKDKLTPDQIKAVVTHVRSLQK